MNFKISIIFISSLIIKQVICQQCNPIVLDLAVMLDVSASIGIEYFNLGIDILIQIVNKLYPEKNPVHLSILSFGHNIDLIRGNIDNSDAKDRILFGITSLSYENPLHTSMAVPIRYLAGAVFNTKRGIAPRITLIITDGLFDQAEIQDGSITAAMDRLIRQDVEVFTMPIGDQPSIPNIRQLNASLLLEEHIFSQSHLEKFFEIVNDKTIEDCNANAFQYI